MHRSVGKQSGESAKSVVKKKRKAAVESIYRKGRFKPEMKERKGDGMDDESGESTEPMGKVIVKGLGELELERLVRG